MGGIGSGGDRTVGVDGSPVDAGPIKPEALSGPVSEVWDDLVAQISPQVLRALDVHLLRSLAGLIAQQRNLEKVVMEDPKDARSARLMLSVTDQIRKLSALFGLSPLDRQRYIPHDVIRRILDECPGPQWRLIVTLCRYAGLRCPSEVLALKWTDIDWERGRMRVDSSKTGVRFVPMFAEVRKALDEAYDAAAEGSVRCVDEYHANVANLRTQFGRILKRAGVEAWPRIFHNLRASRRTELQEFLPDHAINKWMGQSSRVAEQHYITLHDEHWDRALKLPSQCPPTRPPIPVKTGPIDAPHGIDETNEMIGVGGMVMDKRHPRQDSNLRPQL